MSIETRLKGLEAAARKAQAEWLDSLTDDQLKAFLTDVIWRDVPGYPDLDMNELTNEQLERIAAGEDPAVVLL